MRHRAAVAVAWAVSTLASILVALAGVAGVRTAIASPASFRLPAQASQTPLQPSPSPDIHPTTTVPGPSQAPAITGPTLTSTTVTTEDESDTFTTTTATAVTTTAGAGQQYNTYEVEGGWVTILTDESGVYFESASPQSGWSVKVEEEGPQEVVVIFKTHEEETHFKAKFENGQVRITIEEDED